MNKTFAKILCLLISLFLSANIYAQTRDTLYLWPNQVPGENEMKHPAIQTDNTSGQVTRLSNVTNPLLVVFEPKIKNNTKAAVIVCPGGGYHILAIDLEGYEVAKWLNELGYTAFVLQYRVPGKKEGALNDIQRAIRLVRSKADQYELNPDKLGIMGFSAGGSLCARASTLFAIDSYVKTDRVDHLSSRPNFSLLIYPAYLDQGDHRTLTPELSITAETAPSFIFGTADDYFGNSSLVYAGALRDHKISVELHLLSNGGHGYGLRPGNVAAETWPKLASLWLKKITK